MDKGIYCLVFENPGCTLSVGAIGPVAFSHGWHIYVGSALGSGGLKRLARHIALSEARDRKPKWHVDYLLLDDRFFLRYAVYAPIEERFECPAYPGIGGSGRPLLRVQRLPLPVSPALPGKGPVQRDHNGIQQSRARSGHQNNHEPVVQ